MEQLELANIEPLAVGGAVDAVLFGCADCGVSIIRTDVRGETVEAAAYGLETGLPESYVSTLPYPRGLIAISRLLDALYDRFASADSVPYSGELPVVPVAPSSAGSQPRTESPRSGPGESLPRMRDLNRQMTPICLTAAKRQS